MEVVISVGIVNWTVSGADAEPDAESDDAAVPVAEVSVDWVEGTVKGWMEDVMGDG